jgi:alkylation response protein AidB-like acyl-CoA dehydrogenase
VTEPAPLASLATIGRFADEVLYPTAGQVDRQGQFPASHLSRLAELGLFGLDGPSTPPVPPPVRRRIQMALAGSCGTTWLIWSQHHSPVRTLAAQADSLVSKRWLAALESGQALAAVAFAHLRRPGSPPLSAEPSRGGWILTGFAPFVTSVGLADVLMIAALEGESRIRWFLVESCRLSDPGVTIHPLDLAVLQASATVAIRFDSWFVSQEELAQTVRRPTWQCRDVVKTAEPSWAALGLIERSVRLLADLGARDPAVAEMAEKLTGDSEAALREASRLADQKLDHFSGRTFDAGDDAFSALDNELLGELVEQRAKNLRLAVEATSALVAAGGGGSMSRSNPAQRLAREAAFHLIQAQTKTIKAAVLRRLLST